MIDEDTLRNALIAGIAEFNVVTSADVEAAITAVGGDYAFELESRMAEWVVAHVEHVLGLTKPLPKPADLRRDQFATVAALQTAITTAVGGQR
ncbi:hypothetical protein [Nocardia anaemiae]|uniref:hypothetical protein n=1 Tax=Nocardia anaemiae TaxID=263910 RepID=UPI0007A5646B|nr:hypothetical protein [Nocardia anaemiae]